MFQIMGWDHSCYIRKIWSNSVFDMSWCLYIRSAELPPIGCWGIFALVPIFYGIWVWIWIWDLKRQNLTWTQSRRTGHRLVWPVSQIMWLVPEHSIIWDRSQIKKCSCFQVKSALVVLILEEKICIGIIWDWSPDSRGINMTTTPWK